MKFVREFLHRLGSLPERLWRALVRSRRALFAAVLIAVAVTLSLRAADDDSGDEAIAERAGSRLVDERPAAPLPAADRPTTYRVVYDVDNRAFTDPADFERYQREVVVRRPFTGRSTGDGVTLMSVFGRSARVAGSEALVVSAPPLPAAGDLIFDPELGDRRERRSITPLDRECDVYRLEGGTDATHREYCVDAEGFVLESINVSAGRIRVREIAVELETGISPGTDTFAIPEADELRPDEGGGSLLAVDPDSSPPGRWYALAAAPAPFRHRGRYAVIPPTEGFATQIPPLPAIVDPTWPAGTTSVVDVWVDGPRFFAVDQGATRGRTPAFPSDGDLPTVDAGALGEAGYLTGFRGRELRVAFPEGRYVRVYGTVDRETLVDVARALRPEEGGELVYLGR